MTHNLGEFLTFIYFRLFWHILPIRDQGLYLNLLSNRLPQERKSQMEADNYLDFKKTSSQSSQSLVSGQLVISLHLKRNFVGIWFSQCCALVRIFFFNFKFENCWFISFFVLLFKKDSFLLLIFLNTNSFFWILNNFPKLRIFWK